MDLKVNSDKTTVMALDSIWMKSSSSSLSLTLMSLQDWKQLTTFAIIENYLVFLLVVNSTCQKIFDMLGKSLIKFTQLVLVMALGSVFDSYKRGFMFYTSESWALWKVVELPRLMRNEREILHWMCVAKLEDRRSN